MRVRPHSRFLRAVLTGLAFATTAVVSLAFDGDESTASTELERAQEDVAAGRYKKARERLKRVAERFPETESGQTAARRVAENALFGWAPIVTNGRPENRVNVVLMQDGCEFDHLDDFDDIAQDIPVLFERSRVIGEYYDYFNFEKAFVVSAEKGIDGYGRVADTALDVHLIQTQAGDYASCDPAIVYRMLAEMGQEDGFGVVFAPLGLGGTGGGRIATVGSRDPSSILRLFGHSFGTLRVESSIDNGYRGDPAHWINVSETDDPERVPWAHWLQAGVRGIGVHEGADGRLKGAWRPTTKGCRMDQGDAFCPVCREALVLRIYSFVDPIDSARVASAPDAPLNDTLLGLEPHEFEVTVLEPTKHDLEVEWYVIPAREAPALRDDIELRPRELRGPLEVTHRKPTKLTRGKKGVHRFTVHPKKLDAGLHRVLCRVRDRTEMRGEKQPWVLRDSDELLASERGWWVEGRP